MKVFNDIRLANDSGNFVILMLLDLTAAFYTVEHRILMWCLEHWVGAAFLQSPFCPPRGVCADHVGVGLRDSACGVK